MLEVQDIFAELGVKYCDEHNLPFHLRKAIMNIITCRTAQLGGHVDECDSCGHAKISYNSCRDRHCPKCQTLSKERWIENRKTDLLPISYFHVVFTISYELEFVTLVNKKIMYSILFKATSETLLDLSRDQKYLGAEIGFTTILHTWGQNLMNHTHTHNIVPSGGLSLDGTRWISSKKDFFIPVKVLSRKFRGKFLYFLKKAYYNNELKFTNDINELKHKNVFQCFVDRLYDKEWVVYCKPPFGSAEHVVDYLGRYTHRVAISNNRIEAFENGYVTFKWKDYSDSNKEKHMTLESEEFIRRFLMHILPSKFVKIRHYGILSNRNRMTKLKRCKQILKVSAIKIQDKLKLTTAELLFKLTGIDINKCPCCNGKMSNRKKIEPKIFEPPETF